MEWLCTGGEVYHHACKRWTASIDSGICEQCGKAIPAETLHLARDQRNEMLRVARRREVQQRTAATARKLAEMHARTNATLARSSSPGRKTDDD